MVTLQDFMHRIERENHHMLYNAPTGRMGETTPGEFDIFREARVKVPTPGQLMNVTFQPPELLFL